MLPSYHPLSEHEPTAHLQEEVVVTRVIRVHGRHHLGLGFGFGLGLGLGLGVGLGVGVGLGLGLGLGLGSHLRRAGHRRELLKDHSE